MFLFISLENLYFNVFMLGKFHAFISIIIFNIHRCGARRLADALFAVLMGSDHCLI